MVKMKQSKELKNIFDAIDKWVVKHKGKVCFVGSFMAFKGKEFDVIDDRFIAFGLNESLKLSLKEMSDELKKEKEEFVNW